MGKLNKTQKIIIASGAVAILIVIIVTAILLMSQNGDSGSNDEQKQTEGVSQNNDKDDVKDNNDKDNKGDKETSKDSKDETEDETDETESKDETTDETSKNEGNTENSTTEKDSNGNQNNNGGTSDTGNQNNGGGQNNNGGGTTVNVTDFGVASPSGTLTALGGTRVSVHDPSIEYDPATNKWYIFGSHKAFAQSANLMTWSYATGNGSSTYNTIFAKSGTWAAKGGGSYSIDGNLWAPDVIYNKDMEKWCMYMSVNGNNFYSSIAMATADSITGPYTYQGTVVYSGFSNSSDVSATDYKKVTGTTDISRYTSGGWGYYGTNAIDPCVLYDKDGQLWMVYGSWFGGTFMLKLDNETGLRDYTYTYALDTNASDGTAADPYLGKRISGGYGGTGEGPYIVWDEEAGYYYLYLSYCGLNATDTFSGYHMRLFRSKNIEGPYTDAAGHYANRTSSSDDQSDNGIKIMGNYYFSSLSTTATNAKNGYMSPGHNSAIVDNAGNRYVIYHTRFNVGQEWHEVRVHQQFLNEDGWLVTAPYEYAGSKLSATGYSNADIVGTYEFINHGNELPSGVVAGMLQTKEVKLNADGTISGDYTGTWSQKANSPYATMVIGGVTYKGVFFKQFDESSTHKETMTFTLIGSNNLAIWGSKVDVVTETGKLVGSYTFEDTSNLGKDSTGSVGNATVSGCVSATDATRGKVLSFDGSNDYVTLPSAATKHDGYTVMMWFKPTADTMWTRVFDFGDSDTKYMFFTLKSASNAVRFAQTVNGNTSEAIIDGSSISANTWTHVAVTVSASNKKATMYINGKKVGTTTLTAYPNSYSGNKNYLGRSQFDADPYFKGYMDNVYIFDYALSDSEVTSYMNK